MTSASLVELLLSVSWRSIVVAGGVAVVLACWRVRSGAVRHAAWSAVVATMVTMGVWLDVVPTWHVNVGWSRVVALVPTETPGVYPSNEQSTPVSGRLTTDPLPPSAAPGRVASSGGDVVPIVVTKPAARTAADLVVIVWLVGVAGHLVWLVVGWVASRRLLRTSRVSEVDPRVFESAAVAAPCAVGLSQARILMPATWRLWSAARRTAAVRHELEHLRRQDLWFVLLARLNRAIFWFHPLAWWLERRLAAAAEQACDEAVLRAGCDPTTYAELLLDVAADVRARHARVAWTSVGMAGGRQMGRRLDAILAGAPPRQGAWRLWGCGTTVVALSVFVVSCRATAPAVSLTPDPEVTAQLDAEADRGRRWNSVKTMTVEQARVLDAAFAADPDDLKAAETLLWFYQLRAPELMGWNASVTARRQVSLRIVERHPESVLVNWHTERRLDPEGYALIGDVWQRHLARPDISAVAFGNAITFIEKHDPARAEALLLEGMLRFPQPVRLSTPPMLPPTMWQYRLADLWTQLAIGGTPGWSRSSAATALSTAPAAVRAREQLLASTDPVVLGRAAWQLDLRSVTYSLADDGADKIVEHADIAGLADQVMARAVVVDANHPAVVWVKDRIAFARHTREITAVARNTLGREWHKVSVAALAVMPEASRALVLPILAERAYADAEMIGYKRQSQQARMARMADVRDLADAALVLLHGRDDPRTVEVVTELEMIRGAIAWAYGDRDRALLALDTAAARSVAKGADVRGGGGYARQNLTHALIAAGEIEAVATYYERVAPVAGESQEDFERIAEALRAGRMPRNYQRQLAGSPNVY